jgi:hypothetical protein
VAAVVWTTVLVEGATVIGVPDLEPLMMRPLAAAIITVARRVAITAMTM